MHLTHRIKCLTSLFNTFEVNPHYGERKLKNELCEGLNDEKL